MEVKYIEAKLRKIAFIVGTLQGVAYGILSLICIIFYNEEGLRDFNNNNYMEYVNQMMYYFFLKTPDGSTIPIPKLTLRPKVFTAFAWIYLILHILWIGVSIDCLRRKGVILPKYITVWCNLTLFISLWDFVTVVIFGVDHKKCLNWANINLNRQGVCYTVLLPAVVIAARGFVLWFVNVIFAVILSNMASNMKKDAPRAQQQPTAQSGSHPTSPYPTSPSVLQGMHQPYPTAPIEYPQYPVNQPPNLVPHPSSQEHPAGPYGFENQPVPYVPVPQVSQQTAYTASPSQSKDRNRFDFPYIPEPDYHLDGQATSFYRKY